MGKRLIIAEKPSVARDIAQALSVPSGQGGFESDQLVVSSALGHLFEITLPEDLAFARDKWRMADLPLLPSHFDLEPLSHSKQQLGVLLKLLKRPDITGVINACDAGREGELIFLYILRYAKCTKPVERLWLQSMTAASIKESFGKLRPGQTMQPLADAALSRAESDWLVGINGSRALSLTDAKGQVTPVGRVQTPTLAMVVERELEIQQFVPKDYWLVKATFAAKAGTYVGTWFDPNFKGEGRSDRIWEKPKAEAIRAQCLGKAGDVTEETKKVTRNCPPLYDLTTLQREANRKLGFSAAKTLKLAQELYENYKVLTYPRTDARVLPDDYVPVATKTMEMLASAYAPVQGFAQKVLDGKWIKADKRIFNSAKVTDHFAIIPTGKTPENLPADEAALYKMVSQRFVAVFFPAAEYMDTERITKIEDCHFRSHGRVVLNPGWTAVYGSDFSEDDEKGKDKDDSQSLPPVAKGERPPARDIQVVQEKTKPPPRFTEATLLSAMEGAGKVLDDDELKEAMSARGLGTPATRAAIIENLIHSQYLDRVKKELHPTLKGIDLIKRLRSLSLDSLCSPQLTGEWEFKLLQMEQGKVPRTAFMTEISASVVKMVGRVKAAPPPPAATKSDLICPTCKAALTLRGDAYCCADRHVYIRKEIAKRKMTDEEIKTLLTNGVVGPLQGFISNSGRPFAAKLKIGEKGYPDFVFDNPEPKETVKWGDWTVGITDNSYLAEKGGQKVTIYRTIAKRAITPEEARTLLVNGKTAVLQNFISKAGKPFPAMLVLKAGKVEFELPPREAPKEKAQWGDWMVGITEKCFMAEKGAQKVIVWRTIAKRTITDEEAKVLLNNGRTPVLEGFISKADKPFKAMLVLKDNKVEFEFEPR